MNASIESIEGVVGTKVRRDISNLVDFSRGQLAMAAESLASHPAPHVGIICGFFVRHAEPASPETDGLNGMAQLAAGLLEAGMRVTVITDAPCAKAVWAVTKVLPGKVNLEVVDVDADAVRGLRERLAADTHPLTHLVAIERCSLAKDGKPHREHGWDISGDTAPLDYLFADGDWTAPWITIGIGDGGNEIGMGNLPQEIVERDIPNGAKIAAVTGSTYLLVAGVANWGAYGLLAALAVLRPDQRENLLRHFNGEFESTVLTAAVEIGQAIDDSRVDRLGQLQMTIDRLPLEDHIKVIEQMRELVLQEVPA